jgi:flagellar biosynthesis protein FliQ
MMAVFLALLLLAPWYVRKLAAYTAELFGLMPMG